MPSNRAHMASEESYCMDAVGPNSGSATCGSLVKVVCGISESEYPLRSGDDFYIGRDSKACAIWLDDSTISRRHLRIHAIDYDEGQTDIAALVFAQDLSINGTKLVRSEDVTDPGLDVSTRQLCPSHKPFLLNNEDELHVSNTVFFRFEVADPLKIQLSTEDKTRKLELEKFKDKYTISRRKIGSGGFGNVHLAFDRNTGTQLACKIINLRMIAQRVATTNSSRKEYHTPPLMSLQREMEVLSSLNHKNILAFEHVIRSPTTAYIFTELATAGDLMSYVQARGGRLSYVGSAVIVRQILLAVEYLHGQHIVHRDLKLENILMTTLNEGGRILLSDFGMARFLPGRSNNKKIVEAMAKPHRMFSMVGTLNYRAPEMYGVMKMDFGHQGYTTAVDMWSIGNITATLLSGYDIFGVPNESQMSVKDFEKIVVDNIRNCDLKILDLGPEWQDIDKRPKEFVRKLLVVDERERMTATRALEHSWFVHPAYKEELEALYERATANWRPRSMKNNVETVLHIASDEVAMKDGHRAQSTYF